MSNQKSFKKKNPLPDIPSTASATECTGLIQAQIESDEQSESYNELYGIFPQQKDKND